jgi:hypothetical protein
VLTAGQAHLAVTEHGKDVVHVVARSALSRLANDGRIALAAAAAEVWLIGRRHATEPTLGDVQERAVLQRTHLREITLNLLVAHEALMIAWVG